MNMLSRFAVPLVLIALVTAAPLLRAADAPAEPPPRERGPGGPGGAKERLQKMAEHLGLTAEQKEIVGAILKEQMELGRAIREDESLPQEQRREKMQAQGKASREKIRAVLTPEQQAKFDAMPKRGPGGPRGERPRRD